MLINNAVVTGSFILNGVDVTGITGSSNLSSSYLALSASFLTTSASYASASGSLSTRVTNLESTSSVVSSSFATTSGSIAGRVTTIESTYATTGSNNFTKPQQISDVSNAISFTSTASLYTDGGLRVKGSSFISGTAYFNNVVVYGTSSIQYLTSSQVAIGTNIITLNTDTPSIRFGGISVYDSGSNNLSTGSLFWDSEKDRWIYSNPSGSSYDGGMLISGPRNTSGLGNEVGTTSCALMMGQGGDHITSSAIFSYGNATCFYGNTVVGSGGTVCSTMINASCIGIGTTTPSQKLEVSGGDAIIRTAYIGNIAAFGTNYASFSHTARSGSGDYSFLSDNAGVTYVNSKSGQPIYFRNNNTDIVTFTSAGAACFASCVTATGGLISNGGSVGYGGGELGFGVTTSGATSGIYTSAAGSPILYFDHRATGNTGFWVWRNGTGAGTTALTLSSAGAATFSSCVTAGGKFEASFSNTNTSFDNNSYLRLVNTGTSTLNQRVDLIMRWADGTYNGTGGISLVRESATARSGKLILQPIASDGNNIEALTLASTGAATFACSVTAGDGIISNRTKAGSGVESLDTLYLRMFGTPAIGDSINIKFVNNNATQVANIAGILGGDNIAYGSLAFSTRNYFTDSMVEVMRINNRGNVGIGTASPSAISTYTTLDIRGATGGGIRIGKTSTSPFNLQQDGTDAYLNNTANGAMYFYVNDTQRAKLSAGGNFSIRSNVASNTIAEFWNDNTTNGYGIYVRGGQTSADYAMQVVNSSGTEYFKIRGDALISFPKINDFTTGNSPNTWINPASSYGIYINTSSIRYKRNVVNYDKGIDVVNQLRPVYYKGISEVDGNKQFAGFIAEEVNELGLTEFVNYLEDGRPNSLSYPNMIALLTKGMQEQQCTICSQASTINTLKTCLGII